MIGVKQEEGNPSSVYMGTPTRSTLDEAGPGRVVLPGHCVSG